MPAVLACPPLSNRFPGWDHRCSRGTHTGCSQIFCSYVNHGRGDPEWQGRDTELATCPTQPTVSRNHLVCRGLPTFRSYDTVSRDHQESQQRRSRRTIRSQSCQKSWRKPFLESSTGIMKQTKTPDADRCFSDTLFKYVLSWMTFAHHSFVRSFEPTFQFAVSNPQLRLILKYLQRTS
jgi:hypothetical protein